MLVEVVVELGKMDLLVLLDQEELVEVVMLELIQHQEQVELEMQEQLTLVVEVVEQVEQLHHKL